jgi:hypothetical protein
MKTHVSSPLTLAHTFEQFLEVSSFARKTRESYAEDLAPLLADADRQGFLAGQEALAICDLQSTPGCAPQFHSMAS